MSKNYFDEKGNYVNAENKSLAEIYTDGRAAAIDELTEKIREAIMNADAEGRVEFRAVRHGRWIEIEHYRVHGEEYCDCECSVCCHRISRVRGYYPNYCEECGSMNGGAENGKTD